ncbi:histidine kinase [Actinoplanes sp. KI2]|uniref:sensor histidine kinase n=1 Tax=Actinoplanes sp. KI2 TaxID=2983315 RepID=UPI0021D574E9|nr:histidine kinase [Actinoplanes sp. KI2]MCU7727792.1 histidine kinase [Actinoplanes sp. KI2]
MIDLRSIPDRWRRLDVTVRDFPLGLLLVIATVTPGLRGQGTVLGDLPDRPWDAGTLLVVALECLPLAVRRRWPLICLTLVSLGFALDQLRGYHTAAAIALPIALLSAGAHVERHRRVTMVLATAAYVPLAVALTRRGSAEGLTGFATFYLILAIFWGAGAWLRSTRAAEAERRRHVAEATRAAERTRIARELHDVVTHHVTAMVVQAEAARYLTGAPERLDETLTTITDTGRRAVGDLRHLLDVLNPDHEAPFPKRRAQLRELVEQTRRAGQPVEFTEDGSARDPAGSAEVAAYRVVQEALTNALKYAHGSRTEVLVRHRAAEIFVQVSTDGTATRPAAVGGSGRGLAGLRERVDLLGGEFSAGGRAGGGFRVTARIPAGSAT